MGVPGIDSALSGLRASSLQLSIISSNISNANTEGYSRKILPQETQIVNGEGIGVIPGVVVRNVNINLARDLWTQISATENFGVQKRYLDSVQQFHGPPDSGINFSAQLAELKNQFTLLSSSPEDPFFLTNTINQAKTVVNRINDFADFVQQLRNDAQDEITAGVNRANSLIGEIADLNRQIQFATGVGSGTAELEDARDSAVRELSEFIDVDFFIRGDGVMVVQTQGSVELASDQAQEIFFNPTQLAATVAYTANSSLSIYVGNPNTDPAAVDVTASGLGGKIGGLVTLRDSTLATQAAQIDELAHKMAQRFEDQGLRLFTDSSGAVPADTAPNATSTPVVPVPYVGFAQSIQINPAVLADNTLLQQGTYGATLQSGSNEVIARVLEFGFSAVEYQLAANGTTANSVDVRANATGTDTLQNWLGLQSDAELTGNVDLTSYASIASLLTASGVGTTDDNLEIVFDDPDIGSGPYTVELDLSAIAAGGTNAGQDLLTAIQADADWANIQSDFGASVSLNSNGELVINSRSNIQVQSAATNGISDLGLAFLGLSAETVTATDPYFDVQVGALDPVRITIEPSDTETELLSKLNAVSGLAAQIDSNGFLSLRPGNSFSNPDFGGAIKLISGPFTTSSATLAGTAAGRSSVDDGVNVISALFGTYSISGAVISNEAAISDVNYQSEVSNGSGTFVNFRSTLLGPQANISTGIISGVDILDFSQKVISQQTQGQIVIEGQLEDSTVLKNLYRDQLSNESGVNVDQELANLVLIQTTYAASAQILQSLERLFDELLDIVN